MTVIRSNEIEKWLDLLPGSPVARVAEDEGRLIVTGTPDRFPEDPGHYDRIFLAMDEGSSRWLRWYLQCFSRQLRVGGILALCPPALFSRSGSTRKQGLRQRISRLRSWLATRGPLRPLGRILLPASLRSWALEHGLELDTRPLRVRPVAPAIWFQRVEAVSAQKQPSPVQEIAATFQQHFGAWCDDSGLPPSILGTKVVGVESLIDGRTDATVLVLSPHPDDELIGCGGALLLLAEAGASIHVIQMTEGGTCNVLRDAEEADKRSIRWEEARSVASLLGFHSHFWPTGPACALADDDRTRQQLREVIKDLKPSLIFVPAASDLHPEHRLAHRLLGEAADVIASTTRILEYPVWGFLPGVSHAVEITRSQPAVLQALYLYRTAMKAEDYITRCQVLASHYAVELWGDTRRRVEVFQSSLIRSNIQKSSDFIQ